MVEDILNDLDGQLETAKQSLQQQLSKLRTGRANLGVLDPIRVNYYGQATPLNQVAQLSVADARMLLIKPYERGLIADIEKAILASDLGIMPQNDGEFIRLPVPQLTEERRRDLVKQAKGKGEDARIGLRNHRRDAIELLRELEKGKELSQDDLKRALDRVQEKITKANGTLDDVLARKEKEILAI
jgi:ribosome recycling factor